MTVIIKLNYSENPTNFNNVSAIHQSATDLYILFANDTDLYVKVSDLNFFLIFPN